MCMCCTHMIADADDLCMYNAPVTPSAQAKSAVRLAALPDTTWTNPVPCSGPSSSCSLRDEVTSTLINHTGIKHYQRLLSITSYY